MKAGRFGVLWLCMAVTAMTATSTAFAASDAQKAQQARFADCSHQAKTKGMKGADFKSFMKSCARGTSTTTGATATTNAPPTSSADRRMTQQERMKHCNSDARVKDLHGDARKNFMKSCLSS